MSRPNYRDQGLSAENTYNYVMGHLNVEEYEDDEGSSPVEYALSVCYSHLVQKRMEWTIYLQKLAELFLDLAFETEKHFSIKQVLKHYRSITQSQHPDSLRHILEYYRDNKLQLILENNIMESDQDFISNLPNIEQDEASSEIILSSFNPETKNKREDIREKLKIIWDGYKTIIDIVRVNQRLQNVYKVTLHKIFDFVKKYNRKVEFKSFCEYLRSGLRMALNRKERTEQQKAFYIDIEKEEVNTNNIEIRLEQFEVTIKLGLWQEAFEVLQDINQLMKVRRAPVKNSMKCSYFQKLALLFKKSSYWHYHSYAFFNYYTIYITKSKLSADEKRRLSDKLILSVLCIPPSTLQSHQSKESQQKIGSMMISSNRIPEKKQLQQIMVSRGIVQNASAEVKELWYFMFLDFDLTSLGKGLQKLKTISKETDYSEYIELLEDILIYKQLISISQVYQRMKYDSLIKLIPLPKQKIEKVLLESHQRKVIDFVLDQKHGIISFQDKNQQTNPYEEFMSVYTDVALLNEQARQYDEKFIMKKVTEFVNNADNYYWKIRQYKIDEEKKRIKKLKQQYLMKQQKKDKELKLFEEIEQAKKRERQREAIEQEERKRTQLIKKKVIVEDIKTVKQNRVVRINNKKIQNLTDQQIQEINMDVLEQYLNETRNRVTNDTEKRNKKKFQKVDYLERERRNQLKDVLIAAIPDSEKQKEMAQNVSELSNSYFNQNLELKKSIQNISAGVKAQIQGHYEKTHDQFEKDLKDFKHKLTDAVKKKILNKARELLQEDKEMRADLEKKRLQAVEETGGVWSFKMTKREETSSTAAEMGDKWKRSDNSSKQGDPNAKKQEEAPKTSGAWGRKAQTSSNIYEQLETNEQKTKKDQKWGMGQVRQQVKQKEGKEGKQKEKDGWLKKKVDVNANEKQTKNEGNTFKAAPPSEQRKTKKW